MSKPIDQILAPKPEARPGIFVVGHTGALVINRRFPMPQKKSAQNLRIRNSTAEFLTFAYQTGGDGVEVRAPENVLLHLKKIFAENELMEAATAKEFLAVQTEGKRQVQRSVLHYNLDAIVTAEIAREHAESEFETYRVTQDRLFRSDFDTFSELDKPNEGKPADE